jgi:uncharacterized HAD superfamily protein
MAIGVDLDEVVWPLLKHHCLFLNKKYGKNLVESDFFSYLFPEVYGATQERATEDFYEFTETEFFTSIKPFEGSFKGLKELKKLDNLVAVTSRQNYLQEHTRKEIQRYFPNTFSKIVFGNSFSKTGKNISKRKLCDRENVWLLLEDIPNYALEVSKDIPVILFDKHWNKDVQGENIIRAYGWRDATDIARELATNPHIK